ncbi:tRNA synthetases class I, catalytic domain-containing protein [Piptocephalis cylindrospora]|uniref:glutamine--tRNA ligase n=1 Tax=Piptocephalis cylindrospora TaxID=1907219 RepID=A0A4P9Y899_9FUNG|nr:tRNA synthetases class I, catalytic domain-containing protein [Piptocephalis cylindrospora]|eukprot:RKP15386.1 tRNA synthetases class I, catalytic domain-containing protein [Piptocephalis cylindrospora]
MSDIDRVIERLRGIGLTDQRAKETSKNAKVVANVDRTLVAAGIAENEGCSKTVGALLYHLATTGPKDLLANPDHLSIVAHAITDGRLLTNDQVTAAAQYVAEQSAGADISEEAMNRASGVGIKVTKEEIANAIEKLIDERRQVLLEERYRKVGPLLSTVRSDEHIRWAPVPEVKTELDRQILALLGPKDERDTGKVKVKKAKEPKVTKEAKEPAAPVNIFTEGELAKLHKPGGNPQIKPSLMEEHLKATGGKVVTRFPPEPNGFLHIGHAKAINVNFGYAKTHDGICYLRYDDTNPEAEEEAYFTSILEAVRWLGFTPFRVTYSSDYFPQLYDMAVQLIRRGKAYVCHCTGEDISQQRGGESRRGPRYACPHRDRPVEENEREFGRMRTGDYKENEAILRMRQDIEDGNPQMWDLVAYRVLRTPHHRTGDTWCIYPTYDFTHCLVDSLENISHSLCTTEFILSRQSYYWLCDALEVYKPVQFEYGRLNVSSTILSKRKLAQLVREGLVDGWDDPRIYTLPAVRRRGVPPEAVNAFVREVGVTTSVSTIDVGRLDQHVRAALNDTAPRLMAVMEPLSLRITNLPEGHAQEIHVPNHPGKPEMGSHVLPFTRDLLVDRSDYRDEDAPGYYRFAPGKTVGLLHLPHPVTVTGVERDEGGRVIRLLATYETEVTKRPKAFVQWVSDGVDGVDVVRASEVRIYGPLFHHSNPNDRTEVPGGFLSDVRTDSLTRIQGAVLERGFLPLLTQWAKGDKGPEELRVQLVRIGYFCLDRDTKEGSVVMNRIVSLKEDAGKK